MDFDTAAQRSCDNQFQGCSKKANEGGNKGSLTVKGCDDQKGRFDSLFFFVSGCCLFGSLRWLSCLFCVES